MVQDLRYQLENLASPNIEYNEQRVREFLDFTRLNPNKCVRQNYCLDAGCGNGCYSYAMQQLGAMRIDSFDSSLEAVSKCKLVNPDAKVIDLLNSDKELYPVYDFVLSCGILNRIRDPRAGFKRLASLVKSTGGYLHVAVLNHDKKRSADATYQNSPSIEELKKWFTEEGFSDIKVTATNPMNLNGKRGTPGKRDYGRL